MKTTILIIASAIMFGCSGQQIDASGFSPHDRDMIALGMVDAASSIQRALMSMYGMSSAESNVFVAVAMQASNIIKISGPEMSEAAERLRQIQGSDRPPVDDEPKPTVSGDV